MVRPLIQPATMARMQARDERAMDSFCDIHHPAAGGVNLDGSGDGTGADTVVANVPCRLLAAPQATETLIAMRLTDVASDVLVVPVGTVVGFTDRIVKGSTTYEVAGTDAGKSFATNVMVAVRSVQ